MNGKYKWKTDTTQSSTMRPRKDLHFMLRWGNSLSYLRDDGTWKLCRCCLRARTMRMGKRICLHSEMRWIKLNVKYSWTFTQAKEQREPWWWETSTVRRRRWNGEGKTKQQIQVWWEEVGEHPSDALWWQRALCVYTRKVKMSWWYYTFHVNTKHNLQRQSRAIFTAQRQKCTLAWHVQSFHFTKSSFMQK